MNGGRVTFHCLVLEGGDGEGKERWWEIFPSGPIVLHPSIDGSDASSALCLKLKKTILP
ncbi:hypothetical protein TIFTF001_035347 [Ficus carica]|uniref:Uncharacterized protein n=1 Tax=Ficus carica TaxID=3494 RepID=A0AA88E229_FICCA|nr:hypothetical protein TIFTF001_035318 [Ficus carica]GMN66255.1 hypothetical protein TIFTF001_035323 [Ficus carica]GMN66272.1 hypothetical protein TIFTF001_035342 [Ficus carica]GMN66279.1 hypothetical protein TIFTF001_035347 [Ficus carica]